MPKLREQNHFYFLKYQNFENLKVQLYQKQNAVKISEPGIQLWRNMSYRTRFREQDRDLVSASLSSVLTAIALN